MEDPRDRLIQPKDRGAYRWRILKMDSSSLKVEDPKDGGANPQVRTC